MAKIVKKSIEDIFQGRAKLEELDQKGAVSEKILAVVFMAILLSGFGFGGFWLYENVINKKEDSSRASLVAATNKIIIENEKEKENKIENEAEIKVSSSSQVEEKSKADASVLVLNGGTVSGSAGKVKNILIGEGYAKTTADNAQASNHAGQVVYHSKDFSELAKAMVELLKETYPKTEVKEASTQEEKSADIVIILGN